MSVPSTITWHRALLLCFAAAGCSSAPGSRDLSTPFDLSTPSDLSGAGADLASAPDLSAGADLASAPDLSVAADLALAPDDFAPPAPDMAGPVHLVFTVEPQTAAPRAVILPAVQVELEDRFGNPVDVSGSVTISLAPGSASGNLAGTLTQPLSGGIATFKDLSIDTPGYYGLKAVMGTLSSRSSRFTVGSISMLDGLGHMDDIFFDFFRGNVNDTPNSWAFNRPGNPALDPVGHQLFVPDASNNRVLVFALDATNKLPAHYAALVLGQADFTTRLRSLAGFNNPVAVAFDGTNHLLYVADASYNRVLVFDTTSGSGSPIHVLGQPSFTTAVPATTQSGMRSPSGLAVDPANQRLYVLDGGNNRVLVFDTSAGITDGMNAVFVLGQASFTTNVAGTTQSGFSGPAGNAAIDAAGNRLFVTDVNNYRVMVFALPITSNGPNAIHVLGQSSFTTGASSATSQSTLSLPLGATYDGKLLYVTDNGNSRVMVYDVTTINDGMNATHVLGQPSFTSTVQATTQSGMSLPRGTTIDPINNVLYVSDTMNARLLEFNVAAITDGMNAVDGLGHIDSGVMNFTEITGGSNSTFNGPSGLAVDSKGHRLFVADTGNNRVLVFPLSMSNDFSDGISHASFVLGQPDFATRAGSVTQSGMTGPGGLAFDPANDLLYVADLNRVLVFDVSTLANGKNASFVLGQSTFTTSAAATTQNGLSAPLGVALDANYLYVADQNNSRVLVFSTAALANGMNASFVLGQASFTTSAAVTSQSGMNTPTYVAVDGTNHRLYVSDEGNVRVTVWNTAALANGMSSSFVLGQPDFVTATAATTASTLNGAVGLAVDVPRQRLYVDDILRVLVFDTTALANGMSAESVIGQSTFTDSQSGCSDTLLNLNTGPLAIDSVTANLYLADDGNNRVALYNFP